MYAMSRRAVSWEDLVSFAYLVVVSLPSNPSRSLLRTILCRSLIATPRMREHVGGQSSQHGFLPELEAQCSHVADQQALAVTDLCQKLGKNLICSNEIGANRQ